jgi:hypothetical protein
MKLKYFLFFPFIVLLVSFSLHAQETTDSLFVRRKPEEPKQNWMERFTLGGNFGLSFGNPTSVNIAPLIGYRFTDKFIGGGGITYMYSRIKYTNGLKLESNIYGGRGFARYTLIENLAAHVEYEALNVPYYEIINNGTEIDERRRWIGNPLVGAAYVMPLGKRASFGITALYNLNYSTNKQYSPYSSPWVFRMGFFL